MFRQAGLKITLSSLLARIRKAYPRRPCLISARVITRFSNIQRCMCILKCCLQPINLAIKQPTNQYQPSNKQLTYLHIPNNTLPESVANQLVNSINPTNKQTNQPTNQSRQNHQTNN